jgi:hypothetical protein
MDNLVVLNQLINHAINNVGNTGAVQIINDAIESDVGRKRTRGHSSEIFHQNVCVSAIVLAYTVRKLSW